MPRPLSHGTPSRTKRYLIPAQRRVAVWSLMGAALALLLGFGMHLAGVWRVASPGTVAAEHAAIDTRCAQCHQPARAAADLRCERCHDPIDSRRYQAAAHALASGGDAWHAAKSDPAPCAACHTEHRGQSAQLSRVDDRQCASCHEFGSFRGHPEFAALRAQRGPDEGLEFSHATHLREIVKVGTERCLPCHQPTADQRGYEPIAFDLHCARCHIKGNVLTLNGIDLLASGQTYADLLLKGTAAEPAPYLSAPDGRGRVTFLRVGHRDAWVTANAARLSRTLAGGAWAADRARLAADRARLTAIVEAAPLAAQSDQDLAVWRDALRAEIDAGRLSSGDASLAAAAGALAPVATALDPASSQLASQLSALPAAAGGSAAAPTDANSVEERRAELAQLVDAVAARTAGPLAARAADLKKRLAALRADTASAGAVDVTAIGERLNDVDSALRCVAPILPGDLLASLEAARDAVRQQLTGAIDQASYDARRAELVALAAALAARARAVNPARIAELRAAVLALPDRTGAAQAPDRAAEKTRLLERLEIELELRHEPGPPLPAVTANTESAAARRRLPDVTKRIAALEAAPAPIADADPARAKSALRGVLTACLHCHRLTAADTALRPVSVNGPVMPRATFSHKQHILQTPCATCHRSIDTSKAGTDLNVPGVATCRSCHRSTQARSDCAECHAYHPRSSAALTVARWR